MPTIADILAGIDSVVTPAKRRLSDMIRNPLASAQQTVGLLGDRAQEFDRDIGLGVDRRALQNAGSVMAGAPQYVDADRRTVDRMNSLIGSFAPIGLTVYHGSPHKFDKFDASKIGTGEGAQAYGHGLYVAEKPDVAQTYLGTGKAKGGSRAEARLVKAMEQAQDAGRYGEALALEELLVSRSPAKAIARFSDPGGGQQFKDALEAVKRYSSQFVEGGNLYKADLPDDQIAKMLDWDKPIREQSQAVKDALNAAYEKGALKGKWITGAMGERRFVEPLDFNKTGAQFLNDLKLLAGEGGTAEESLRALGIPGIRYLDGGSRGAGQGTSNFVVFPGNEGLLKILERNGEPVK